MKFGLRTEELDFILKTIKAQLDPSQKAKVFLFGSRATGKFKTFSDIDLLVGAIPVLTGAQKDVLEEAFEESELPYKVALVLEHQLQPSFRPIVDSEKVLTGIIQ
ncbi:MAG: nucleotidyltransferase domain-containing protein [Bdellovibrionota bacterium]